MTHTLTQKEYNESAMYELFGQIMYENGVEDRPEEMDENIINDYFFNREHSLDSLKRVNRHFYMFLKTRIKNYGKYRFDITNLNTIYGSLILNNIEYLNIYDCNIGINDSINTLDKEFVCLRFDNINTIYIKDSSFDYPLYFTPHSERTITLENCIIDTLFIEASGYINLSIEDCYINNIYILRSAIAGEIKNSTIKHLYTDYSNISITSKTSNLNELFENIYCYKTFLESINIEEMTSREPTTENIYKTKSRNITFYEGNIKEYDDDLISKLVTLNLYTILNESIYE